MEGSFVLGLEMWNSIQGDAEGYREGCTLAKHGGVWQIVELKRIKNSGRKLRQLEREMVTKFGSLEC